jgi:hypothetical protein
MGFLRFASIIMLTNCYSPDARNWRSPDAGVDAPRRADARPVSDARIVVVEDARAPDAAPGPLEIHLQAMGGGEIVLGSQICDMDCTFSVAYGASVTLEAIPDNKQKFDRWTTATCGGQPAVCTFVANQAATVGARFVKAD